MTIPSHYLLHLHYHNMSHNETLCKFTMWSASTALCFLSNLLSLPVVAATGVDRVVGDLLDLLSSALSLEPGTVLLVERSRRSVETRGILPMSLILKAEAQQRESCQREEEGEGEQPDVLLTPIAGKSFQTEVSCFFEKPL